MEVTSPDVTSFSQEALLKETLEDGEIVEGLTLMKWTEEINNVNKLSKYAKMNKMWVKDMSIHWIPYNKILSKCMCECVV